MRTRRRELERAARTLLAAHVRQVGNGRRAVAVGDRRDRVGRRRLPLAAQVGDRLRQVAQGNGLDPGERGLRAGLRRAEEVREPRLARALRRRQHAADRPQPPVQRQLADRGVAAERFRGNLPRGREHRQRDRQVEAGSFLPELGGREVDGDPPRRPLELGRGDPGADSFLGLLTGAVGEPDDRERRDAELQVRLDLDPARVESDERVRDGACEHMTTLGRESARVCAGCVPRVRR